MLSIFVPGKPVPKQSFKYRKGGGYTPARVKAWQDTVAYEVKRAWWLGPLENPDLTVELVFCLPDNRKRDLDNLSKAILDALNGIVWVDDKQITKLVLGKVIDRGDPGVMISVGYNS